MKHCGCIHLCPGTLLRNIVHDLKHFNWHPFDRVERECSKDIYYSEQKVHIKKGTVVTVPSFALHYDPDYYEDPESFNPDRYVLASAHQTER